MIRAITLLRLKFRDWMLTEEAAHVEALMDDHKRRFDLLIIELRRIRSRIATLERPEVMLRDALRRKS